MSHPKSHCDKVTQKSSCEPPASRTWGEIYTAWKWWKSRDLPSILRVFPLKMVEFSIELCCQRVCPRILQRPWKHPILGMKLVRDLRQTNLLIFPSKTSMYTATFHDQRVANIDSNFTTMFFVKVDPSRSIPRWDVHNSPAKELDLNLWNTRLKPYPPGIKHDNDNYIIY